MALATERVERIAAGRRVALLDAGCETGLLTVALARAHPDWDIVAVDLNDASLDSTQRRVAGSGATNVRVDRADLTTDLGSAVYDVVVALECLAEIPRDDLALQRMATALRPEGRLVLHVPLAGWRPVLPGGATHWKGNVRGGYSPRELDEKLAAAGLRVVHRELTTHAVVHLAQELREFVKLRPLKVRMLLLPVSVAAVWLERHGLRWGRPRGQIVEAGRA